MRKNLKRKRIVISILFVIIIIVQILAFKLSTANNVIELKILYIDNNSNLSNFDSSITAIDKSGNGYLIILPETVNGIKVNKYYIEENQVNQKSTEIEEIIDSNSVADISNNQQENSTNEIIDNNVISNVNEIAENQVSQNRVEETTNTEIQNSIVLKNPGEEVYITKKSIEDNLVTINVEYDSVLKDNQNLYNQEIETFVNDVKVTASGYMPENSEVLAEEVNTADIQSTISKSQKKDVNINFAYDIKIKSNEKEYEPDEFESYVQISINGIKISQEENNKILHIKNDKTIDEINVIEKKVDEVTFQADSFSVYALVSEADDSETLSAVGLSWDGTVASSFKFGEGTKKFPYLITSGNELAYLANQVNSGITYENIYFQLTEDLNLNNISWTPIGNITNSFRGIFDGAGHTIGNVSIVISSGANGVVSYGVFGSIGGGTNYSEIKNVEFNNVNIDLAVTRTISSSSYGYKIGIVTGTMYNHSRIVNVVVKNSEVLDSGTITFGYGNTQYQPIMFVGGIAGDSVNSETSTSDPGNGSRYEIKNCYSNVNFNLDIISSRTSGWGGSSSSNMASFGQYNVGGIIGRIKSQAVWPDGCLYTGAINATNAFTGPIFAVTVNNTSYTSTGNFNTLWNGNDIGSLTMSSYYSAYSTNGSTFTASITSGNAGNSTTYRRSTSTSSIGYVQGVNKGVYISPESAMYANFNNYANNNGYSNWEYTNNEYSLLSDLAATVDETTSGTYVATVTSNIENPTYTYKWYVDGSDTISSETNTIEVQHELEKDHTAVALISDGTNYSTISVLVKRYTLYFDFTGNTNTKTLKAVFAGTYTQTPYFNESDYNLQWYSADLTDRNIEQTPIENATTLNLVSVNFAYDFVLIGTNTNTGSTVTGTYTNKTVIYVDYQGLFGGNNSNDGLSPETPVQTLASAYSKLDTSNEMERNIVVAMSNYTGTEFLSSSTATTYAIPASVVGLYNGVDYSPYIYFEGATSYRYLEQNTRFKNLSLNGSNSQTYLYLQGFNLIMDDGINMINYAKSNTNQGLIAGNSPAFHIFGGWYRYNYGALPRNNNKILIKSGTYGRIIAGGSPGAISGSSTISQSTTSHNFTGSSLTDIFTSTVDINIENSTTDFNTYTYDVNLLVGGSAWGNTYANVTENIYSGIVGRVLGGSIGDSSTASSSTWTYPSNTYIGYSTVNILGGTVSEVYGGSLGRNMSALSSTNTNLCDAYYYGTITVNIVNGNINKAIYGAGAGGVTGYSDSSSDPYKNYGKDIKTSVNINISGGTIDADIYGGGYGYTEYLTEATTTVDGGTLYGESNISISDTPTINGNIYGAGRGYNLPSKTQIAQTIGNSNIRISGTPIVNGNVYGAGEGISGYTDIAKLNGIATVIVNANITKDVYGGGNIARLNGTSRIYINGGENTTSTIYGGGNVGEISGSTYVYVTGGNNNIIYGGGNLAGVDGNTNIQVKGGNSSYIYGGGNQAGLTGNTYIQISTGTVENVFGGGNQAGATNTTIDVTGTPTITNLYGGSNQSGTVTNSELNIQGGVIRNVYGGGKVTDTDTSNVNLISGTIINVYGGGESANINILSNVNLKGSNVTNIFGGSNKSGIVPISNIITTTGASENVYGGNDQGGTTTNSNVQIQGGTIQNVYGGNNQGGTTVNSNVTVSSGNVDNVFGGGNQAETNNTNVKIQSNINSNVYGGGNLAGVTTNTNLEVTNTNIGINCYGGGNEGTVGQNTNVNIHSSNIIGSVYAGGNGTAAIVYGNTNLNIDGTTIIGTVTSKSPVSGCVFGGGNAAATGTENSNSSQATVNIVGAKIYGNVYGGANTSVVYGSTKVNIGYNSVNNSELQLGDIYIVGTVFGGGEANASGSETYDFSFISVTTGIDIHIDGTGHNVLKITGSIFGSGNASSTSGSSYVNFNNYGTKDSPEKNISLQRATVVTLNNSVIGLSGTTDRTNDYSDVIYTLSRIDELKLKNNSEMFLNCGANLLKKVSSLIDNNGEEQKAVVTIDNELGTITRNVDNRIYMYQGQNLNIATNQQASSYGDVEGMIFFGLFTNKTNPNGSTGLYSEEFDNTDKITNMGTFSYNSYVKAAHKTNHDTTLDGFYSNYNNDGFIETRYVEVTPEDDVYYIWLAGENLNVTTFNISLTASKYTTLGTYELSLTGFSVPNTQMILTGFSSGLEENIKLVDKSKIPTVALTSEEADSNYGLTMKSGNNGWMTNGTTDFTTENGTEYSGSTRYNGDNSTYTPSLLFYLYHSQNLTQDKDLGTVTIRLQVLTPIDDLNYDISYIDVIITMKEALHQGYAYEASITPGEEFSLFTTTPTNITSTSKFSTYYSLYEENFSTSDYYDNYGTDKRVLVSTKNSEKDAFVYPENTKITMIDLRTNEFYYYVVTSNDEQSGKYVYNFSDFYSMGSTDKKYDELNKSVQYYDNEKDIIAEEFIFQVDFSQTNINTQSTNNYLLMELRNTDNATLIGVLGINRDTNIFGLYPSTDATIKVNAQVLNTDSTVYLGNTINVNVSTNFEQRIVDSNTVYDTEYFNNKMGIKLTIYDNNGNQVSGDSLLGIKFILDGTTYYPRTDGTVRINIAERIANVLSKIKIDTTENNTLATGNYTIKVESFGSPDGIYYGTQTSSFTTVDVYIINLVYGLDVETNSESKIVDSLTGTTQNETNILSSIITYSSGLTKPNLTVALYRRNYDNIYSQDYEIVDLQAYILTTLAPATNKYEYIAFGNPGETNIFNLFLKTNLITGTYKLEYKLYDDKTYIGNAFEYLIIK